MRSTLIRFGAAGRSLWRRRSSRPGPAGSARVVGSPVTITGPGLDASATATAACPGGTTEWTATAAALLLPRHDSVTVTAYALCSLPAS